MKYDRVLYLGSVKICKSLIDFQPEHREQIVSQAILKLFKETDLDLEPNLPKNDLLSEVDHLPHSKIDSILGDVKVAESPKSPATVVITSKDITISTVKHNSVGDGRMMEVQQKIARHQMDVISFASLDMSVYVSYVAKEQDSTGQSLESSRACHVVHCEDLDQANKMYNAFETAFNKNNRATLKPMVVKEPMEYYAGKSKWDDTIRPQAKSESDQKPIYYNEDPAKIPPISGLIDQRDRREYVNQEAIEKHINDSCVDHNSNSTPSPSVSKQTPLYENTIDSILQRVVDEARKLPYFHHSINRSLAEQFLTLDGDFLIRDSSVDLVPEKKLKNICLSVRNDVDGVPMFKHIVLINNGQSSPIIHTRDNEFNTIQELLEYFQKSKRTLEMPRTSESDSMGSIRIKRAIKYGNEYV